MGHSGQRQCHDKEQCNRLEIGRVRKLFLDEQSIEEIGCPDKDKNQEVDNDPQEGRGNIRPVQAGDGEDPAQGLVNIQRILSMLRESIYIHFIFCNYSGTKAQSLKTKARRKVKGKSAKA